MHVYLAFFISSNREQKVLKDHMKKQTQENVQAQNDTYERDRNTEKTWPP